MKVLNGRYARVGGTGDTGEA